MVNYEIVKYNDKKYCICCYDDKENFFVCDMEDLHKIQMMEKLIGKTGKIYRYDNDIYYRVINDGNRIEYCIRDILLDETKIDKNQKYKIYHVTDENNNIIELKLYDYYHEQEKYRIHHISINTNDYRKANIDIANIREQQYCRQKSDPLPLNCNFDIDKLPDFVYYHASRNGRGDMFVIEIRDNNQFYRWTTTDSNDITFTDKLAECIKILWDIIDTYPGLLKGTYKIENLSDKQLRLMKEFNDIISLCSDKRINLTKIPQKIKLSYHLPGISAKTKEYLDTTNTSNNCNRSQVVNDLPKNCGITDKMIPEYCYYKAASDTRGDFFGIEYHPSFLIGRLHWCSSFSNELTTQKKFISMLKELKDLERPPVDRIYEEQRRLSRLRKQHKLNKRTLEEF